MDLRAPLAWVILLSIISSSACTGRATIKAETENGLAESESGDRSVETGPPVQLPIPALAEFEQPNAILLAGRLYPIGWSKAGLFAYVHEPPDEACGCYFAHLVVQDLVSDRIEWNDRYESGGLREDDPEQIADLEALWRVRGPAWSERLEQFGIERTAPMPLRQFAEPGQGSPQVRIETTEVGEDSAVGFAHITRYQVELVSAAGSEVVFDSDQLDIGPLSVEVLGYLELPDSPQVAILLLETWRGWEGQPHVAQLRFVGAQMD
jgi:hypothetical protein